MKLTWNELSLNSVVLYIIYNRLTKIYKQNSRSPLAMISNLTFNNGLICGLKFTQSNETNSLADIDQNIITLIPFGVVFLHFLFRKGRCNNVHHFLFIKLCLRVIESKYYYSLHTCPRQKKLTECCRFLCAMSVYVGF